MQRALDLLEQAPDAVQREAGPACAEVPGDDPELLTRRFRMPLGEAEPNCLWEATRSICTDISEGSNSRMPTTEPMPKFICPDTWL